MKLPYCFLLPEEYDNNQNGLFRSEAQQYNIITDVLLYKIWDSVSTISFVIYSYCLLFVCCRFFIESIAYLRDNATIELFYLQAKSNVYRVSYILFLY